MATTSDPASKYETMAKQMLDEEQITSDIAKIRSNLFRQQLEESFSEPGGPSEYWKQVEMEWRRCSGGKPIPTKYRTNKSVILKAWNNENDMSMWIDGDGEWLGKSAIQHKISALHRRPATVKTAEGMAKAVIHHIERWHRDVDDNTFKECAKIINDWSSHFME